MEAEKFTSVSRRRQRKGSSSKPKNNGEESSHSTRQRKAVSRGPQAQPFNIHTYLQDIGNKFRSNDPEPGRATLFNQSMQPGKSSAEDHSFFGNDEFTKRLSLDEATAAAIWSNNYEANNSASLSDITEEAEEENRFHYSSPSMFKSSTASNLFEPVTYADFDMFDSAERFPFTDDINETDSEINPIRMYELKLLSSITKKPIEELLKPKPKDNLDRIYAISDKMRRDDFLAKHKYSRVPELHPNHITMVSGEERSKPLDVDFERQHWYLFNYTKRTTPSYWPV